MQREKDEVKLSVSSSLQNSFCFLNEIRISLSCYLSVSNGLGRRMQQDRTVQKWRTKSMPLFLCGVIFPELCRINPFCSRRSPCGFRVQSKAGIRGRKSAAVVVGLLWPFQVLKLSILGILFLLFSGIRVFFFFFFFLFFL